MTSHQGMLTLALALSTVVLLTLPSLLYGEILHVRPTSTSTVCATHPCHNLSEYAHLEHYFNDSNLTLQFLPGNHTLDVNLTITSIHNLVLLGNSSAVVPTGIVCSSNVGIIFRDIPKVKVDGLAFSFCAQRSHHPSTTYFGLYIQSVQMAEIIDCIFQDSYGSALGVVDSYVVLRGNNRFINNCRQCSNGRHLYRDHFGGGVFVHGSNLSFTGSSRFIGNSAESGGGIYAGSNSNVDISGNTTFIGNAASIDGGGVYLGFHCNLHINKNTTFINNSAGRNGGGIYSKSGSNITIFGNTTFIGNSAKVTYEVYSELMSTISNSTFIGNSAGVRKHGRRGLVGGMYDLRRGLSGRVDDTYFSGVLGGVGVGLSDIGVGYNTFDLWERACYLPFLKLSERFDIHGQGGGIYIGSNANISGNTTFLSNLAQDGGGIYARLSSNANISGNTIFLGNLAKDGGGIYAEHNSNAKISGNTTFNGNVGYSGGGVYMEPFSNINISGNTTFIVNSAKLDGGGVYSRNIGISGNTTFIGNTAEGDGGGLYSGPDSNVGISGNTTFIGNSAERDGGGVYFRHGSNVGISGNTTFIGNSAERDGGGVYFRHGSNVGISGNTTFIGNSAEGDGGGVYCGDDSNVGINGNNIFIGNSAERDGGGICAGFYSIVRISGNTTFSDNSANGGGGGVCAEPVSIMKISGNTTFVGNSAMDGGGVLARSISNVNANGTTTFIGNMATDGGGLHIESSSNVKISGNTTFISNSAVHGGCIFLDSSLRLDENVIFTNCSAIDGGAIYARGAELNFNGTNVFSANRATHFGGALYTHKSSLKLDGDNIFTANSAESRGGSIYAQQTKIRFSGTGLLNHNVAQLDGGGIYADSSNLNFSGNITIRKNTAQVGGGVYSDNNTFNMDGHVVERNAATYYGGGIYTRRSSLTVAGNNTFVANTAREGGGMYATANTTLILNGVNNFIGNKANISGGGIWLDNSNLVLHGSNHFVECAASYEGGAIFTYAVTASLHGDNIFESNSATTGGGIHARWSKVCVTKSCSFKQNIAVFGGGIYTDNSTFSFSGSSTFRSNQANYTGGGIHATRSALRFLFVSFITANHAVKDGGGIYAKDGCMLNLLGLNIYQANLAGDTGGGISALQSNVNVAAQNTFASNKALEGGGVYTFNCTVNFLGENTFITNSATSCGGGFTVMHSTLQLNGSITFRKNIAASGGGIYISDSIVDSNGGDCFINNMATSEGGGMYVSDSVVKFNGKDLFAANSAGSRGAAIHTSFTTLIFQGSSSFVNNSAAYGGGVHCEHSNLTFGFIHHAKMSSCINCDGQSTINFFNNLALRGGAQYFDLYSNFSLYQTAHVHFQDNYAFGFGGAIYVADIGSFFSQTREYFRNKSFLHVVWKEQSLDIDTTLLVFSNNSAGTRGSVLYGGLLNKCNFSSNTYRSALELFKMSILNDTGHSISSDPTQLCFCNISGWSCREVTQSRSIYPGQNIEVSVLAIDQSSLAIPTLIHTRMYSGNMSEIISYETEGNCTSRNYSVTPKRLFSQLELHPTNRSGNATHLTVIISLKNCPIGFEQSNFSGECICDHRLWQYTNSCDIERQAILRNASTTFWLGVWYNNKTFEGFIHHLFCPLDYCTSGSKSINLKNPDKQCNSNHSGLLCGKCKEGLSLVLGSSQCKECSNNYLSLLVPFALAGVLLVVLLFILHLTVTAGTLHGLIFYANIVAANHHIFFPQSSNNPGNIFIAWLNLDLGIETCFYNGMDAYAKMWLEFVFPIYICVIVGILIYISQHSIKVTKLLGSSPVPVLSTLFFLSYAKILQTIISALSLTILHYPHKNVMVWVHDANVSLAKYIPLALVALLFLLFLFLPYTLLLLLGQWLQHKSHLCILSWVNNYKVKAILDTYHAPYEPKYRFWTGLLLLLRCALFLAFAFNISGDESVNLLVISSATLGIFVGYALLGRVYKSWYLNALEVSFILNLGILAAATYHVKQSGGSQAAVVYTSVGIAFLTFVGIITYHIYIRIKSNIQYNNQLQRSISNSRSLCHQPSTTPTVTHTEVNLHELRSPLDLLSYHKMN